MFSFWRKRKLDCHLFPATPCLCTYDPSHPTIPDKKQNCCYVDSTVNISDCTIQWWSVNKKGVNKLALLLHICSELSFPLSVDFYIPLIFFLPHFYQAYFKIPVSWCETNNQSRLCIFLVSFTVFVFTEHLGPSERGDGREFLSFLCYTNAALFWWCSVVLMLGSCLLAFYV